MTKRPDLELPFVLEPPLPRPAWRRRYTSAAGREWTAWPSHMLPAQCHSCSHSLPSASNQHPGLAVPDLFTPGDVQARPRSTCQLPPSLPIAYARIEWTRFTRSHVLLSRQGGSSSLAEWLACSTQAQKGLSSNRSRGADG